MFCWRGVAAAAIVSLLGASGEGWAADRVALVIGNGAYQKVRLLPNPPNDASDVGSALNRLGFSVRRLTNGTFDSMRRALLEFGRDARGSEIAVVFFAGHGMEVGGENWLIPIDAELRSDLDVDNEAINLRTMMLQVSNASRLGFVILDACRNNPFGATMQRSTRSRSVDRGFARIEPTDNILVAYAAKDGTTADDGNGRNSPYTAALLNNIETPGLEVTFMLRRVRDNVMTATMREQQPYFYGSLSKDEIYLKSPDVSLPPPPSSVLLPPQISSLGVPPVVDLPIIPKILGMEVTDLTRETRLKYKINGSIQKGVLIADVDKNSDAAEKRLSAGDVIVEVAQEAVTNAAEVRKRVDQLKKDGKKSVLLLVANADGELRFVALSVQ